MSSLSTPSHFSSVLRARNTRLFATTGMAAAWASTLLFGILAFQTPVWQYIGLTVNGLVLSLGLTFAYLLNRNQRTNSAIWLTAILVGATFISANLFVQGLGVTLAVIGLLILLNLALQTLEIRPALGLSLVSALFMVAAVWVDTRGLLADRITIPTWAEQTIIVLGGLVILTLSLNLLERFEFKSLRGQLTLAFLLIALIPLWITSIPQLISIRQTLAGIENDSLLKNAQDTSSELDDLLGRLQEQVSVGAEIPVFQSYLLGDTARSAEALSTLQSLTKQEEWIISAALIDSSGIDLLDTQSYRANLNVANVGWFRQSMILRDSYISDMIYNSDMLRPTITVTAIIFNKNDPSEKILGLVRLEYDAQIIQQDLERQNSWLGTGQQAILLDQNGIILGHNALPTLQLKTITALSDEQAARLQAAGLLPPGEPENFNAGLTNLAQALTSQAHNRFFKTSLTPNASPDEYATMVDLANKNWRIVFARSTGQFSAQISNLTTVFLLISSLLALAVIIAASITANIITAPIKTLTLSASEIGQGNLDAPIKINRRDEIGILSAVMETTAQQLRDTLAGLEKQIADRTQALEESNQQSQRRETQLRALAEVASAVTDLQELEVLLPRVTETISRIFGFYHAGIFLLDASGSLAILRAANSEGGQKMLRRGHQLQVGQVGIVGYVTANGEARIALNVGADTTFFNNPDLPETRSEMALPLKIGTEVIGALDIQSREPNAFNEQDIEILSLLADQIAIAIHNARLYAETNQSLLEAQSIFGQQQQDSWQAIGRQSALGFRYYNGQTEALRRGEVLAAIEDGVLQLPISLRGKSLGIIQIHQPQQKTNWSAEEIHLYQTVVERLAYALENARLFQDAQRLASKEQVIGQIGAQISASINLDTILQTTVQELSHFISDSEIVIQLRPPEEDESAR